MTDDVPIELEVPFDEEPDLDDFAVLLEKDVT